MNSRRVPSSGLVLTTPNACFVVTLSPVLTETDFSFEYTVIYSPCRTSTARLPFVSTMLVTCPSNTARATDPGLVLILTPRLSTTTLSRTGCECLPNRETITPASPGPGHLPRLFAKPADRALDWKSVVEGKKVSVSVNLG